MLRFLLFLIPLALAGPVSSQSYRAVAPAPEGAEAPDPFAMLDPPPPEAPDLALIGRRRALLEVVMEQLDVATQARIDREARRLWSQSLAPEQRSVVRRQARTLFARLAPDERAEMIRLRREAWNAMTPAERANARANDALAYDALPRAYRAGLQRDALAILAPDLLPPELRLAVPEDAAPTVTPDGFGEPPPR